MFNHPRVTAVALSIAACLIAAPQIHATATWPNLLNYQGQLTDSIGNAVADGSTSVVFSLYTVASGANPAIWTETQSVTSSKGLFSVVLGSVNPLAAVLLANSGNDLWISLKVASDAEMTPRQQLLASVYATQASNASTLSGSPIGTAALDVVQLDASSKIPAGLVGANSISLPLNLSGSGMNVNLIDTVHNSSIYASTSSISGNAVQAASPNINYYSDTSNMPLYGFYHNDLSPIPAAIGVYSHSSCSDCTAGYFYNTSGTAGPGGALYVYGRMNMPTTSGSFTTGNNVSSYTIINSYIRQANNTTIILTPTSNSSARWWISSIGAVTNQAVVSFSTTVFAASFQYVILGK